VSVVAISTWSGLVVLALMLPVLPAADPTRRDLFFGAVAGVAVGAGIGLLYRALAIGRMAVIAPTTAVCAVVIPVIVAMLWGERPGATTLVGIALAIASIALISRQRTTMGPTGNPRAGFGLALASGVGIGVFFLALSRVAPSAGLWPLLVARAVPALLFGIALIGDRRPLSMSRTLAAMVIGGGVLDMFANVLYLLATHHGPLSVVVTLSSLYPASTVLLALAALGERLTVLQAIGIACALLAVLLIVSR